ncbi:103_t:CDS:2, partial [Dentiscutata erythropus]
MDTEEIYSKVYDFLVSAPPKHITATSVIFQGIEEDSEISQNVLKTIVNRAVANVNNLATTNISRRTKLLQINPQELEDDELRDSFMEPKRKIVPRSLPTIVQRKCKEFVNSFIENHVISLPRKLTHNGEWKESGPELANVTEKILDS